MAHYLVPDSDALERWLQAALRAANGKKQEQLAQDFLRQYYNLRDFAEELTLQLNQQNNRQEKQ